MSCWAPQGDCSPEAAPEVHPAEEAAAAAAAAAAACREWQQGGTLLGSEGRTSLRTASLKIVGIWYRYLQASPCTESQCTTPVAQGKQGGQLGGRSPSHSRMRRQPRRPQQLRQRRHQWRPPLPRQQLQTVRSRRWEKRTLCGMQSGAATRRCSGRQLGRIWLPKLRRCACTAYTACTACSATGKHAAELQCGAPTSCGASGAAAASATGSAGSGGTTGSGTASSCRCRGGGRGRRGHLCWGDGAARGGGSRGGRGSGGAGAAG